MAAQNNEDVIIKYQSEYSVAKTMMGLLVFIGYVFIVGGIFALIFSFDGFGLASTLIASVCVISGLLLIMGAQITIAVLDTADYTREILKSVYKKN